MCIHLWPFYNPPIIVIARLMLSQSDHNKRVPLYLKQIQSVALTISSASWKSSKLAVNRRRFRNLSGFQNVLCCAIFNKSCCLAKWHIQYYWNRDTRCHFGMQLDCRQEPFKRNNANHKLQVFYFYSDCALFHVIACEKKLNRTTCSWL